jgi:NADH-quinone oxidoreductase subunit G
MRFDELLKKNELQGKVELKGSFCMERCGEGINWRIDDELMTSKDVDEAVKTLEEKVIGPAMSNV